MDTIKTAFVVALLLAVLYGVYVVLNKEPATPPPEVAEILKDEDEMLSAPDIQVGSAEEAPKANSLESDAGYSGSDDSSYPNDVAEQSPSESPGLPDIDPGIAEVKPPRAEQYLPRAEAPPADREEQPYVPGGSSSEPNLENPLPDLPDEQYPEYPGPAEENYPDAPADSVSQPDAETEQPLPPNPAVTAASSFDKGLQQAQDEIQQQQYAQALLTASAIYTPDLTDAQRKQLEELLDPLAAKVIYSREHLLAQPYTARGDETLMQIALDYKVPWQLLQNINGVENPDVLLSGTTLKVVEGPFRAEVDSQRGELTLYLNQLYAGRFTITVGDEPRPTAGEYSILSKQQGRPYYVTDGRIIPANDEQNPYGDVWMELIPKSGQTNGSLSVSIHGTPPSGSVAAGVGCISLSPRDAQDIFGILIEGSQITVLR